MHKQPFRILLVEDIHRHQKIYERAIVDELKVEVLLAGSGDEAVKKIFSDPMPDLIVLDLTLPGLSGEEVLKKVRSDGRLQYTPVIILTGMSTLDKQLDLLEQGADDFIEKGSAPEIFVARLKTQMRHKLALDRMMRKAVERDLFAAGVLHDIRNIETNILTGCQLTRRLLSKDVLANKDKSIELLDGLTVQASKLGSYAADVIDSVRETEQETKIRPQKIEALIEWIVSILGNKTDTAGNAVTVDIPEPLIEVLADRHFLRIALLNILQNAIKFARPSEKPHITITQIRESDSDDPMSRPLITTRIRDNGKGIHPGDLDRIFEPFVSGDGETEKGFGLGLSMVSKVIVNMGGRVWAEIPEDGPGSIICVQLPSPKE